MNIDRILQFLMISHALTSMQVPCAPRRPRLNLASARNSVHFPIGGVDVQDFLGEGSEVFKTGL